MKLGEELDEDEIDDIITNVDPKKTGKILFQPFCAYIMSKWANEHDHAFFNSHVNKQVHSLVSPFFWNKVSIYKFGQSDVTFFDTFHQLLRRHKIYSDFDTYKRPLLDSIDTQMYPQSTRTSIRIVTQLTDE